MADIQDSTTPWGRETDPLRAAEPSAGEIWTLRVLIVLGLAAMVRFLVWFVDPSHIGQPVLFALLTLALLYKLGHWLYEWRHYFHTTAPPHRAPQRSWSVDVFTTSCPGEPKEMIIATLKAMVAIRYPHESYLCDEGNDPELRAVCRDLGVHHVTRDNRRDAKAGNINQALQRSHGEICVILDPDHEPHPAFLDRVLGHFEDQKVGFVQVVQAYHNQQGSLIARGAAEQTYMFYGPMMMGMQHHGTVQAIGANCTFRRAALESIGGHKPGLAEDMHTAMSLHAAGWTSVYVPEVVARGRVPSTLHAYWHQQLKWAAGCFELLFQTYPRLFRKFTPQQRLHYFLTPLYYLYGVIGLIDFAVPIACLFAARAAWAISLPAFIWHFLPLFGLAVLIRQSAQRWVLHPEEQGLHIIGGLLRAGTRWIYLVGFLCALLRIRIPYLPTPKEDDRRGQWLLSLPNLAAATLSLAAIAVGLHRDWSPFALLMAGFAGWNAVALTFCLTLGPPREPGRLKQRLSAYQPAHRIAAALRRGYATQRAWLLSTARRHALWPAAALTLCAFGMPLLPLPEGELPEMGAPAESKEDGGFYLGFYLPELDQGVWPESYEAYEQAIDRPLDIVSFYQAWGPESITSFPMDHLRAIRRRGAVPMITWEPWTSTFPEFRDDPELSENRKVFTAILEGRLDAYLERYAARIRAFGDPVMLRFAHEQDNPHYPWSASGGNSVGEFIAAWHYVVEFFDSYGASNVTWVWNPWRAEALATHYPGGEHVDWIAITLLNYGPAATDGRWHSFEALYEPFAYHLADYDKPVLLAEFGSLPWGGSQQDWLREALRNVPGHPELRGLVFFHSDRDVNWPTPWRPEQEGRAIDWTFIDEPDTVLAIRQELQDPFYQVLQRPPPPGETPPTAHPGSPRIQGGDGAFELTVDGRPFYVRGVAYNTGHDWRDGTAPLARHQLEQDFSAIRNMGANTIRRYAVGWADRNVLNLASEHDLKVLMGFWFAQDVDYLRDEAKRNEYEARVLASVRQWRDHPAVLGWTLGNEVWGLLKHRFEQPYLSEVRRAYVQFLEHLAGQVHEIDPEHPVLAVLEHTEELPAALHDFAAHAPSLDAIGVNAYYLEHLRKLHLQAEEYDPRRPYLVTEFGPPGYWHADYTERDAFGMLTEPAGWEKAEAYRMRWTRHIQAHRGRNLGGVAFSWRDRMEGTVSWYGITDAAGARKPPYESLRELWTGQPPPSDRPLIDAIRGPGPLVQAGGHASYRVVLRQGKQDRLQVHWSLRRQAILEPMGGLKPREDGLQVDVVFPNKPGEYRLYATVRDREGWADTFSRALRVSPPPPAQPTEQEEPP